MEPTWWTVLIGLATLLVGSGGVLGWKRFKETKDSPSAESSARLQVAPELVPDWKELAQGFQKDLEKVRSDMMQELEERRQELVDELEKTNKEVARLRRLLLQDDRYIAILINHIWAGKPPPPPSRPYTDEDLL